MVRSLISKWYLITIGLFLTNLSFSQTTILYQDFESAGDNWNYTLNPATYDVSGDVWAERASLSAITPSSGSVFWGMRDLNNSNGGGAFDHTITMDPVNITAYTGVVITFDYYTIGYDATDYINYEVFEDGVGQGTVTLNASTGAWTTVTYNVANTVSSVYIVFSAFQNGGSDYAGIDNIDIAGTSSGPCSEPSAPTTLTISGESSTTMDLSWSGGGPNYVVVGHESSAVTSSPVDGSTYTASSTFGSGDDIGTNEFVVYSGSGTSVTVSGLTASTDYYFTVFSYDCSPEDYETSGASDNSTTTAPSSCASIFSDDFSGTLAQWSNNADWTISSGELEHNLSGVAGSSYNYADIGAVDLTGGDFEWEFCMRNSGWDPSGSNQFVYWLISDATNLLGAANGYAVGINQTSTSDEIMLYEVTGGTFTEIITIPQATFDWSTTDDVCFRVTRTAAGGWELFYNPNGSGESSGGTVTDNTHTTGQYTGPAFTYTSSRAGLFWVDDINICGVAFVCPGADTEPTSASSGISFSNVGCDGFQIDWTSGNGANRIVVVSSAAITGNPSDQTAYSASATYGSGSTLNAGEYVVYNGNGNSVTISNLNVNTTYFVEIFEYNGATVNCEENYLVSSTVTSSQTTLSACTNPELTGILVDACGGASEGINEFFTFDNGTSALNVDDITVTFPFAGTYCNTSCSAGFVTNSTFVNQLNTTAGCAGLFVEADPIPAGASVIVFTGSNPSYAFDFSGLCGSGPYYALFLDNTSTSGRFANYNSICSNRTLTVDFNGTTDDVTYDCCLLSNTDGDYVSFASDGTATYANDGCTPTATLPIELLDFNGKSYQDYNQLFWQTATEINNDYFEVQKSTDGFEFNKIGAIKGAGNSSSVLSYSLNDNDPDLINYYRLKQVDFDGTVSYSKTIVLKGNSQVDAQIFQDETNFSIVIDRNEPITIQVMNAMGQVVYSNQMIGAHTIAKSQFSGGIYFVRIQNENFTETYKVIF